MNSRRIGGGACSWRRGQHGRRSGANPLEPGSFRLSQGFREGSGLGVVNSQGLESHSAFHWLPLRVLHRAARRVKILLSGHRTPLGPPSAAPPLCWVRADHSSVAKPGLPGCEPAIGQNLAMTPCIFGGSLPLECGASLLLRNRRGKAACLDICWVLSLLSAS